MLLSLVTCHSALVVLTKHPILVLMQQERELRHLITESRSDSERVDSLEVSAELEG